MTLKNTDKIKTSLKSFVLQTQAKCVWRATGEFIKFLHKDINRWQTFRQIGRFRRTNSTTRFSKNLSTKETIFCQRHLRSKLRIVTPQIYYYRLGNLNLSMLFVMVYGQFLWELRHIVSLFFFLVLSWENNLFIQIHEERFGFSVDVSVLTSVFGIILLLQWLCLCILSFFCIGLSEEVKTKRNIFTLTIDTRIDFCPWKVAAIISFMKTTNSQFNFFNTISYIIFFNIGMAFKPLKIIFLSIQCVSMYHIHCAKAFSLLFCHKWYQSLSLSWPCDKKSSCGFSSVISLK